VDLACVLGDEGNPCRRLGEPSRRVRRLAKDRRAEDEYRIVRRQLLPQPRPVSREEAGEERMVLRKAGARAERLLEHRHHQALGKLDERRPRLRVVGARADHERR
jgi:hypothetical protein